MRKYLLAVTLLTCTELMAKSIVGNDNSIAIRTGPSRLGPVYLGSEKGLPSKKTAPGSAFRTGKESSIQWSDNLRIPNKSSIGKKPVLITGAFASSNATANNDYSTAFGTSTTNADYSFAGGNSSIANGLSSFAYGQEVVANGDFSVAFGKSAHANGEASFAMGEESTVASGNYSFAFGNACSAGFDYSFAMGSSSGATYSSFAFGRAVGANGGYSAAFGDGTSTNEEYTFVSGVNSSADGWASCAFGFDSHANAESSFAAGNSTTGDLYCTAFGSSIATGEGSFASGYSYAGQPAATAMGASTAIGMYSSAFGSGTAKGNYASSFGLGSIARSYSSTVFGNFNHYGNNSISVDSLSWVGTDPLFEIGNGTSISARSNAVTVLKNGKVGIGTTDPQGKLHVHTPGQTAWEDFVVKTTSLWGDGVTGTPSETGGTQYVTIGAGAAGIMLATPHVVWSAATSSSAIRYGRSGGIASGTWWEGGVNAGGGFHIRKENVAGSGIEMLANGNLLIGQSTQTNAAYKLDVAGSVRANKVVVNTDGADYVFDSSYQLLPLDKVEQFVKANKHLPEIAPAAEMQQNGLDVGGNQTKLLQKVEELTLYLIAVNKQLAEVNKQLGTQNATIQQQQKEIDTLKRKAAKH